MLDQDACYEALRAHDARFDGRFFVGVSSTGIYCRTVCHAKLPKRENCTFYETPAQAEAAGYRPCLACRPELAPGWAPIDAQRSLARRAARLLREECAQVKSLDAFAERLGYTGRHLRRAFVAEFGVTPVQYLQTCRLLTAKQLLQSTRLPIAQVARIAGFGSQRRFDQVFKDRYRVAPSALRRGRGGEGTGEGAGGSIGNDAAASGQVELDLAYRPPYDWDGILSFLGMRAIPGVESVEGGAYRRIARLRAGDGWAEGWIEVRPARAADAAHLTVSSGLFEVLPQVIARVRHLFDLDCDPIAIAEGLRAFDEAFPGRLRPGLRVPGCFDAFEMGVRAILGQQVSVKGAGTLAGRVAAVLGTPVDVGVGGLTHAFPDAATVAALPEDSPVLEGLGIVRSRIRAIRALACALEDGSVDLTYGADPDRALPALEALPGIGPWTAQYLGMRALGWPDAFPAGDLGVRRALEPRTPEQARAEADRWRPWRAYAVMALWSE